MEKPKSTSRRGFIKKMIIWLSTTPAYTILSACWWKKKTQDQIKAREEIEANIPLDKFILKSIVDRNEWWKKTIFKTFKWVTFVFLWDKENWFKSNLWFYFPEKRIVWILLKNIMKFHLLQKENAQKYWFISDPTPHDLIQHTIEIAEEELFHKKQFSKYEWDKLSLKTPEEIVEYKISMLKWEMEWDIYTFRKTEVPELVAVFHLYNFLSYKRDTYNPNYWLVNKFLEDKLKEKHEKFPEIINQLLKDKNNRWDKFDGWKIISELQKVFPNLIQDIRDILTHYSNSDINTYRENLSDIERNTLLIKIKI